MQSMTQTTTATEGCAHRQSSFAAGHTNSGPFYGGSLRGVNTARSCSEASFPSRTEAFNHQGSAEQLGRTMQSEEMYYHGMQIIGEQVIEHEMSVPTRRLVEEIVEKVVVVPEKIQREEICEEKKIVRERIVQVAQPVDKKVYVDEIQVVQRDKIVEVPQVVQRENVIYQDVWTTEEVVKEVPRIQEVEKVVEYDVIEYKDVPVHRTVEVPERRVIEKTIEKPVPRYVEVDVPEFKEVEVVQEVHRSVPVPVEHTTHQTFNLPTLEAQYEEVPLPVFVPSFTEVPLPAEYMTDQSIMQSHQMRQRIAMVAATAIPSLCVIENLGQQASRMTADMVNDPEVINQRMAAKLNM